MKFHIQYQESYSRKQLLLRTFLGYFYLILPHALLLGIYSLWVAVLQIIAWFSILFTTRYPKSAFDALEGASRWQLRVNASFANLVDGYPPFGPDAKWDKVDLHLKYPEIVTRKRLLFITFFGSIVLIPHIIVLYFLQIAAFFGMLYAWFIVLFTGHYPEGVHHFIVGLVRWQLRVGLYASYLYFSYPEFTMEETAIDKENMPEDSK